MILADTSAWIEFLRGTGSPTDHRFDDLLATPGAVAVTDPVLMEVLAGARGEEHERKLVTLLGRASFIPTGRADYEAAARIHIRCRLRGDTPRNLIDCLIAAVALRSHSPLLHADRDFDVIARHFPLEIA